MSGKRQHYIPRFLLRGFLDPQLGGAERTWLHRRDAPARLVSIRDVGVEEYFYSSLSTDGSTTLDDEITSLEGELATEIRALRALPDGSTVDSAKAIPVISHLMVRTAHVRSVFAQGTGKIVEEMAALIGDTESLRGLLRIDGVDEHTELDRQLDIVLQRLSIDAPHIPAQVARRVVKYWVRENFNAALGSYLPEMQLGLAALVKRMPAMVREAHNRALSLYDRKGWTSKLGSFQWRVQAVQGAVLPDCLALVRVAGEDFRPLILAEDDPVELVLLPLGDDCLLVGFRDAAVNVNVEALNAASAACSDSFFISRTAEVRGDPARGIGSRSARFLDSTISEALAKYRAPGTRPARFSSVATETSTGGSFSYTVTLKGLSEELSAQQVGEVVQVVVGELSHRMDLSGLEGITFAADYESALSAIDRGDASVSPPMRSSREYGIPVARSVAVVRDGHIRRHIVMHSIAVNWLLSNEIAERTQGVHLLVSELTGMALEQKYSGRPVDLSSVPAVDVGRFLIRMVLNLPIAYAAARESAFADPSVGETSAKLVVESLLAAQRTIQAERLRYRVTADLDSLLEVASAQMSFVLTHAAQWAGHQDGLPDESPAGSESMLEELKPLGLDQWIGLLGRDLRDLWSQEDPFLGPMLHGLTRHAERLLWTVWIFPWLRDDESIYISVPFGDDLSRLEEMDAGGTAPPLAP